MIKRLGSGLLAELTDEQLAALDPLAHDVELAADEVLFKADEAASHFYVIESGLVTLELQVAAGPAMVVGSVSDGDLLGLSWLFPPYTWKWSARASAPTKALGFEAAGVRDLMDADHELGYRIVKATAAQMKTRLTGVRLQLMDLYGSRR